MVKVDAIANKGDLKEEWVVKSGDDSYYCGIVIGLAMGQEGGGMRIRLYVKPDLSANRGDVRIVAKEEGSIMTVIIAHAVSIVMAGK